MSESRIRLLIVGALTAFVVYVVVSQIHFGSIHTPEDLSGEGVEVGETVRLVGIVAEPKHWQGSDTIVVQPEHASEPWVTVRMRETNGPLPDAGTHVVVEGMVVKPGYLQLARVITPSPPSKYAPPQPSP